MLRAFQIASFSAWSQTHCLRKKKEKELYKWVFPHLLYVRFNKSLPPFPLQKIKKRGVAWDFCRVECHTKASDLTLIFHSTFMTWMSHLTQFLFEGVVSGTVCPWIHLHVSTSTDDFKRTGSDVTLYVYSFWTHYSSRKMSWCPQVLGAASSGARANILCDSTGVWENEDIFKLKISSTGVPFPRRSKKPKEKTPGQVLYC